MREIALLGAGIERAHRVGAERAKTHRRDVEHRSRIRLLAIRATDGDAKFLVGMRLRRHRMVHPFIAFAIDVLLGAERPLVEHHLGALIDHRAGVAARTACRPSRSRRNIAASPGGFLPAGSADAPRSDNCAAPRGSSAGGRECRAAVRRAENDHRDQHQVEHLVIEDPDAEKQCRDDAADRQNDEAWRERKHQRFHGIPLADPAVIVFAAAA